MKDKYGVEILQDVFGQTKVIVIGYGTGFVERTDSESDSVLVALDSGGTVWVGNQEIEVVF